MPTPKMSAPLSGCVTIDSKTPDAYLDNARAGNPRAGASATTQEAVNGWLAMLANQPGAGATASLVGHGAQGDIDTGSVQGESINLFNQPTWVPLLRRLQGKVTDIYLFAPSVGAGEDGARLLYTIAQAAGATVHGPAGLIYCNAEGDFFLESGAVWQTATPVQLPPPIAPPAHILNAVEGDQATAGQTCEDQAPLSPGAPGDAVKAV